MIEQYFSAVIRQSQERAKILKGKITGTTPAAELIPLNQLCQDSIDKIISDLDCLMTDPFLMRPNLIQERVRLFRRSLDDLTLLETTAITALTRSHSDDIGMSKLVFQIHKEIKYPLLPPTVSCLSREYFSINTAFRLLEVPLAESDFLLHLPDLYHEMGHPLIATRNNPKIDPYQVEYSKFLSLINQHFDKERSENLKSTGPKEYIHEALENYEYFWVKAWANEIFCDLFAVYTLGPAYGWAHFHLTACRDVDPFDVELIGYLSHPPDQARMEAILIGLELIDFKDEATEIQKKWDELLRMTGVQTSPMYRRACPKELLQRSAIHAFEGVKKIDCRILEKTTSDKVHDLLNLAWKTFWTSSNDYHQWERKAIDGMKKQLLQT